MPMSLCLCVSVFVCLHVFNSRGGGKIKLKEPILHSYKSIPKIWNEKAYNHFHIYSLPFIEHILKSYSKEE